MGKRPKAVDQLTSAEFDRMFPVGDEDACKAYLKARRWRENEDNDPRLSVAPGTTPNIIVEGKITYRDDFQDPSDADRELVFAYGVGLQAGPTTWYPRPLPDGFRAT